MHLLAFAKHNSIKQVPYIINLNNFKNYYLTINIDFLRTNKKHQRLFKF